MQATCQKSPTKSSAQDPTSIVLSANKLVFTTVGEQIQITATVLDKDSKVISDAAFIWKSENPDNATVSSTGLVTAVSDGTTHIKVYSGYATASAIISVEQRAGSVEISPTALTLTHTGQTGQFSAVVKDKGDSPIPDAPVVWSSSKKAVATVNADGLVTAVSNGTAQINAASGDVSASVTIVVDQAASSMTITPETATLGSVGATVQLEAVVYDLNGTVIPGVQTAWSSSERSVATVNADGVVTAVSNGTTQISATSGDVSASATIVVEQAASSIAIAPEAATLGSVGATVLLEAVVYDMAGVVIPGVQVTWSSSERSVATVNADGVVTAVSNGTAQISAASGDVSASVTIVVAQVASSIAIAPEAATLEFVGATIQFEAMVFDSADVVIPDAPVTWSSSETGVATVDTTGIATSVGSGTATITAMSGESSGSATLSVTLPPPPAPPPEPPPIQPPRPPAPPPTVSDLRVFTIFMSYTPVPGSGTPGFVRPGTTIELTPWVINDGPESSPSTRIRLFYSTDRTITTSDTQVLNFAMPGLSVSERFSKTVSTKVPSTAGTYFYGACVDGVAGESNTSNNCSLPLRIFVE